MAIKGAISGGSAFASTGNPWLIAAGAAGGALLEEFGGEETAADRLINKSNRLTLRSLEQQNRIGDFNLRSAKRMEDQETLLANKKRTIGRQLGRMFAGVR
jgi:hypothetical protein